MAGLPTSPSPSLRRPASALWPLHLPLGVLLIAVSWALNWSLPGLRSHLLFFPLWLGAILVMDAIVLRRSGTSLLSRSPSRFVVLFVLSVPLWWLFEALNLRTRNWQYLGEEAFSPLSYALYASWNFSIVVPAVFEAAELLLTTRWISRLTRGPRVPDSAAVRIGLLIAGAAMLALLLVWPKAFYPLLWVSFVFLLEPLCRWLGRRSLLTDLQRGDWRRFVALWAGTLLCGFLWELWNSRSSPKWIYHVPGAEFWYLFEMPALGYLGYLPFGLEVYLFTQLLWKDAPALQATDPVDLTLACVDGRLAGRLESRAAAGAGSVPSVPGVQASFASQRSKPANPSASR